MKSKSVLLAAGMLVSAVPAMAGGAADMKPGLWEVVIKMEVPGMPMAMPPMTTKQCLTAEQIAKREDKLVHPASRDPSEKCELKSHERRGNTMTMTMSCTASQGTSQVKGRMIFDSPTAYHGEFDVQAAVEDGRTMHMTQHFEGKRTGDCSK